MGRNLFGIIKWLLQVEDERQMGRVLLGMIRCLLTEGEVNAKLFSYTVVLRNEQIYQVDTITAIVVQHLLDLFLVSMF